MKWILKKILVPSILGSMINSQEEIKKNNLFIHLAYNIEYDVYILSKSVEEYMDENTLYKRCIPFFENRKNKEICYMNKISDEEICSICIENMAVPIQTACKHFFCRTCILTYYLKCLFENSEKDVVCPNCREVITYDTFPVIVYTEV
jgi:hypothetical protein